MAGVYVCDSGAKDGKVGAVTELEVVPSEWTPDVMPDLQLKRIVAGAATSLRPAD